MAVRQDARHEDYSLAVGEELTRAKAASVLARYGDEVRDAAAGLVQQFLDEDPARDVATSVCSVDQLLRHCPGRGPGDGGACLGTVSFLSSSGYHRIVGIHVDWDTEEVRVLD